MKVLTIGGATQDVFIHYTGAATMHLCNECDEQRFLLLKAGSKIEIDKIHYSTGGGATNSAASFSRLGFATSIFCKIGTDSQGSFIKQHLEQEGIAIDNVIQTHSVETGISYVLPTSAKDRTILAYRGANATIKEDEIPYKEIQDSDAIYITSLSGPSSQLLLPIAQHAKKHNRFVANNPGVSQLRAGADILRKTLPYIDVLILNTDEAKEFMLSLAHSDEDVRVLIKKITENKTAGSAPELLQAPLTFQDICFDLRHFFQAVLQRGPKIVVVTNGAEGVYAANKESLYFHPSFDVEIEHTTVGAGDSFGSCFVASILKGTSVEDALRSGIINACSVIGHEDAKSGLLSNKELKNKLEKIDKKLLQIINNDQS